MAENQKQVGFVDEVRSFARSYRALIEQADALTNRWASLYNTIVDESDMPDAIIPSGDPATRLASFMDAISNINTIISDFDAGIDTNFERISG